MSRFYFVALARRPGTQRPKQHGLTLVELLVALTISLLIALAAAGVLVVARQGFRAVDATGQLRDDGRFATEVITRVVQQAGHKDPHFARETRYDQVNTAGQEPEPYVQGINNAVIGGPIPWVDTVANSRSSSGCTSQGPACANGSDVLMLRYQSASTFETNFTNNDRSILNCAGGAVGGVSTSRADMAENILYVGISDGEPSLMCHARDATGLNWGTPQPLVQGVESFQVLFGMDGVIPNDAPGPIIADKVPDHYLTAAQINVPTNPVATTANWRRVRTVRIGLVIRGPVGSATVAQQTPFYPLGGEMAADTDPSSEFTPPNDRRLRQSFTFTINLRNEQGV